MRVLSLTSSLLGHPSEKKHNRSYRRIQTGSHDVETHLAQTLAETPCTPPGSPRERSDTLRDLGIEFGFDNPPQSTETRSDCGRFTTT